MAAGSRITLLRWQLDVAWSLLELHLGDLTDAECLWEPTVRCWTVRRHSGDRWRADWEVPEPEPAPAPTIAWLLWHIGFWWTQTHESCFGTHGRLLRTDLEWPGSADAAVNWIVDCKDRWSAAVDALGEEELDSHARSGWFLRGTKPFGHVVAWVNTEVMRNAAELGMLRKLHAAAAYEQTGYGQRPAAG
jgi:hypothetical protein